jgi:sugar phosphate permease
VAPSPESTIARRATVRSEAAPLLAAYWSFGQFWGVFTILLLEFQAAHGYSDGELGLEFSLLSVTAVLTMLFVAPRMQGWPLGTAVPVAIMALAFGTVGIALGSTPLIPLAAVVVGAGNGLIDIYVNVAAQQLEARTRRPILQWLHASYAFGGVTGALAAGLLRTFHVDYRIGFGYAAVVLFLTAGWNGYRGSVGRNREDVRATFSLAALIRTPFLWIPAVALLGAFLVEGSMDVWSGLYLREELGASAIVAAAGFMAFSGAACVGRLFASRVLFRLGRRTTILISGLGAAAAGAVSVLTHSPVVAGAAFLLMGFTLSAAGPAAFGLVEDADEDPTSAIAAVTTVGYTGFVWSPPLIGWIAATSGLRAAMVFVVAFTSTIVGAGLKAPRNDQPRRITGPS